MKYGFIIWAILGLGNQALLGQIPFAHAHNDYEHTRPLFDALEEGFMSVEADIHLIDGELYVYHDHPGELDIERTLEKWYLDPLMERVRANGGGVYSGYEGAFLLLVDVKTEAEPTYAILRKKLKKYKTMLRSYKGDKITRSGAVMVVISGNRPKEMVALRRKRLVAIDGRPSDIGKGYSSAYMPLISDHYRNQLRWDGEGDPGREQENKLKELAQSVHAEGKTLRLWATPEKESMWRFLLASGVDYLNTDELKRLHDFAVQQQNNGKQ